MQSVEHIIEPTKEDRLTEQQLKDWTKALAIEVVKLVDSLPKSTSSYVIGRQLVRSACSVWALTIGPVAALARTPR
jgi:hypothetical protein